MDKNRVEVTAFLPKITYNPLLCKELKTFDLENLDRALRKEATFVLNLNKKKKVAVSRWVSAKRTRSYPYVRVYDSLCFKEKKITIIPVYKDEGYDGDRDYLQWDTISLMSLLGVYVIVAYYESAEKSNFSKNKITKQEFSLDYVTNKIKEISSWKKGVTNWNVKQMENISLVAKKALDSYEIISRKTGVKMSSRKNAEKRIKEFSKEKKMFMEMSRLRAKRAQKRESLTTHIKEKVDGSKATVTIGDHLGGLYHFTADEIKIRKNNLWLVEAKNSIKNKLPSLLDIKDGIFKMILFSNLKDVCVGKKKYTVKALLRLTTRANYELNKKERKIIENLEKEAKKNGFDIQLN